MKKRVNRILAVMLCVLLLCGAAPTAGLAGIADWLQMQASAEDEWVFVSLPMFTYQNGVVTIFTEGCPVSGDGTLLDPNSGYYYTDIFGDVSYRYSKKLVSGEELFSSVSFEADTLYVMPSTWWDFGSVYGYGIELTDRIWDDYCFGYHTSFYFGLGSVETPVNQVVIDRSITKINPTVFKAEEPSQETISSFVVDANNPFYCSDENGALYNKDKSVILRYPPVHDRLDACVLPDSVTTIGRYAFYHSDTTSLTIPSGVTSIGDFAFYECPDISNIILPDSMTNIGKYAFMYCAGLTSVKIGNGVENIGYGAFAMCENLTDVRIGEKVTSIGDGAFANCKNLRSIHIPSGVTEIDQYAFSGCDNLQYICCDTEDCYAKTFAEAKGIEFRVCEGHETVCEHDYTSAVTTEPTCAAAGVRTYTCTICGDSYTEDIAKLAHTPEDVTEPATCTADGRQYTKCAVCGETLSESVEIPAPGHAYNAVVTKEPTCSAEGVKTFTCTRCGDSYTESIDKTAHTPEDVTEPATCTADGKQYTKCSVCGETLGEITALPMIAHSFGAWVTVTEPTTEAEGLQERTCTYGCGTKETQVLPKIPTKTVTDSGSGISLTYPETAFEGDAQLQVEQVFDGAAFNLVDLNSEKNAVFDITMVKDGAAVQPNGKVTVRIPVPSGFDPAKCMVYHVNTKTGKLEKMNARYENGFMVFETDHFSYYAIVIEKPIPPTVAIRNYTQSKTVDYRTTITFTAEVTNPVSGAAVHWYINGQDKGAADTYTEKEAKATYTVQTKYIKDGKVLAESETETVNVKTGFFAKLKAFFRALFGRLPKQVQEAYDLDLLLKLLP